MRSHYDWPFFDAQHAPLAERAGAWIAAQARTHVDTQQRTVLDAACRAWVKALGAAGWLRYCVPAAHGGALPQFDARSICILRELLAEHDGLADFAFAMQGLGSAALAIAGDAALAAKYLPAVAHGDAIAAFALSEANAGSDVAAMQMTAQRDGAGYVLNGEKTWISNGGIADFYCVFARTNAVARRADGSLPAQGISAFVVEAGSPGLIIAERIDVIAPHPLARLRFADCRVAASRRIGAEGEGFKIAMRTLDVFRSSVAAAALGFARRALAESLAHTQQRAMFGSTLSQLQLTQAAIAEMATSIDAAALLTYRAAWQRDRGQPVTRAAAMAKLTATESAQMVIDRAVQLFGGQGVQQGSVAERLYREIRALRIYEGASEVQKLIIARETFAHPNN
jgi:acyl-CoA dehydrogenase